MNTDNSGIPRVSITVLISVLLGVMSATVSAYAFRDKIFSEVTSSLKETLSHFVTREEFIQHNAEESAKRDYQYYTLRDLIVSLKKK